MNELGGFLVTDTNQIQKISCMGETMGSPPSFHWLGFNQSLPAVKKGLTVSVPCQLPAKMQSMKELLMKITSLHKESTVVYMH